MVDICHLKVPLRQLIYSNWQSWQSSSTIGKVPQILSLQKSKIRNEFFYIICRWWKSRTMVSWAPTKLSTSTYYSPLTYFSPSTYYSPLPYFSPSTYYSPLTYFSPSTYYSPLPYFSPIHQLTIHHRLIFHHQLTIHHWLIIHHELTTQHKLIIHHRLIFHQQYIKLYWSSERIEWQGFDK